MDWIISSGIMFFLGGMLIVGILCVWGFITIKKKITRKINSFSQMAFGTTNLRQGLMEADLQVRETPKSLAGMDSILLPKIKKDFPDFNIDVAESHIRKELKNYLKDKSSVKVHNIVIHDYKKHTYESVIVMQAAVEYIEKSGKVQKRYTINYVYSLVEHGEDSKVTAVCPNCGAPISNTSHAACDYCGSAIVDIIERNWEVKDIIES